MDSRATDAVAKEIAEEKAESLSRAASALEHTLRELREYERAHGSDAADARRNALVARAAERVLSVIVQREAAGLRDPNYVFEFFAVPRAVVTRLGARER
jgi:hypothetical protein